MKMSKSRLALLVGSVALLVLAAISWLFVLSPRLNEAADLSAQAASVSTANLAQLNEYNRGLALARKAPGAAADAQALFAKMPQTADLPEVLDQLTKAAIAAGIEPGDITTITTSVPIPVANPNGDGGVKLATMQVQIGTISSEQAALTFLDNLQQLDRAMLINSTSITQIPDAPAKKARQLQVGGTMFVLQSNLPDLVGKVNDLVAQTTDASTTDATTTGLAATDASTTAG